MEAEVEEEMKRRSEGAGAAVRLLCGRAERGAVGWQGPEGRGAGGVERAVDSSRVSEPTRLWKEGASARLRGRPLQGPELGSWSLCKSM